MASDRQTDGKAQLTCFRVNAGWLLVKETPRTHREFMALEVWRIYLRLFELTRRRR